MTQQEAMEQSILDAQQEIKRRLERGDLPCFTNPRFRARLEIPKPDPYVPETPDPKE